MKHTNITRQQYTCIGNRIKDQVKYYIMSVRVLKCPNC
nr:MAG TPA: hypothetical protein [Caudoviricetes sp.]